MRSGGAAKILGIGAGVAAAVLALAAYLSFRSALSARIDRADALQGEVVRPAAAARLLSELAAHRLARVSEEESRAVAGAFRRTEGEAAVEAYRKAGGDPALLELAQKALAAERTDPAGDVAFLRAIRALRGEASRVPAPPRPDPPSSAAKAGVLILGTVAAAGAAAFFAWMAGRSPSP